MGTPGPQMVDRYGVEFKLTAVKMSQSPGVLVKDAAESLCIHPFMLSKWRKQVREGVLVGTSPQVDPDSFMPGKGVSLVRVRCANSACSNRSVAFTPTAAATTAVLASNTPCPSRAPRSVEARSPG